MMSKVFRALPRISLFPVEVKNWLGNTMPIEPFSRIIFVALSRNSPALLVCPPSLSTFFFAFTSSRQSGCPRKGGLVNTTSTSPTRLRRNDSVASAACRPPITGKAGVWSSNSGQSKTAVRRRFSAVSLIAVGLMSIPTSFRSRIYLMASGVRNSATESITRKAALSISPDPTEISATRGSSLTLRAARTCGKTTFWAR